MRYPVEIEGIDGRVEVVSSVLSYKIHLDGAEAPKGDKWLTYHLPRADGGHAVAQLKGDFTSVAPSVVVDGHTHPVGPKFHAAWLVLILAPLALIGFGGALGGLCGAVASYFNRQVAGSGLAVPLKVLAMLAVGAAAVLLWLIAATAISMALA